MTYYQSFYTSSSVKTAINVTEAGCEPGEIEMYEDFNYITDESFLTTYWWKEQLLCPYCEGIGKLSFDSEEEMIDCHLCQGTGWIHRQQHPELNDYLDSSITTL